MDPLASSLQKCLLRIVDCVLFFHSLTTVTTILGATVSDHEQDFGLRLNLAQLGGCVPDCRAHAGGVQRRNSIDLAWDCVCVRLPQLLNDVELYVLSPVAGEAIDTKFVTQHVERV